MKTLKDRGEAWLPVRSRLPKDLGTPKVAAYRALARLGGANLGGAVLTWVYLAFLLPLPGAPQGFGSVDDIISLGVFVAYTALAMTGAFLGARRYLFTSLAWIAGDRKPAADERRRVLAAPRKLAVQSFRWWIGAAVVFGLLNLVFDPSGIQAARIALGILLGGLTTVALAFVLVEHAMRPLFAEALAGAKPERPPLVGLRARLMILWVLGSGLPLAGIGASVVLGVGAGEDVLVRSTRFLTVTGLAAGGIITAFAAKSLSGPIDEVRDGLESVERGELSVEITVDSPAELGMLQSGFNQMVQGLRERRQLQDLFGRHVGEEVARRALQHGARLGGEKLDVSVLFVDVIGSTAAAEQLPPEQVVEMLNAFFDAVVRAVGSEGGWVNKFEGDGAMSVFGAPDATDDHPARALRAARSLQRQVGDLRGTYPLLDAGIGLSSGRVVAGNVGAAERYEYTVIGDPVNEAARLTEEAKRRQSRVLAAAAMVAAAGDRAGLWRAVGPVQLRGRTRPVEAYEPAG